MTLAQRREEYEQFSLEYWSKWFKLKDGPTDFYFAEKMKNLKKAMDSAAGNEYDHENFLPLSDRKIIDEEIKRTLRK